MLAAALGCNLAWGVIDGGIYLLARLNQRGRAALNWRELRIASNAAAGQRIVIDALPPLIAQALMPAQVEAIRQQLHQLPEPERPRLTRRDWLGALGVCLLSFLSTFPIAIPFLLVTDAQMALRASNAIAVTMLFLCGFVFGRCAGFHPMAMGLSMVALGGALVGVAIALGG
jgi:VIT1/CCC1 family predicted Fe2+/Mn2+ transporter